MKLSQRNRRILVFIFGLIAMPIIFEDSMIFQAQWFFLALVALCFIVLLVITNAQAFQSDKKLDERQIYTKLKAIESAYGIFIGIIIGELIWPFDMAFQTTFNTYKIIVLLLLATALPTVVLTWLEPDPIPDNIEMESSA